MADTDQQLKMVKSMLRATLISSKDGIPADTLLRDYEELTMEPLPFKSLGFSSLEEFIQSIPDVVEVIRNADVFVYKAVPCTKTQHVIELVRRQKSRGKTKNNEARKPGRQNPTQRRAVFDRMGPRPKVPDHAHIGLSMSANAS
ncbi:hypothetical protein ACJMK2_002683 [Sinanodonta woodiana]|uniref:HTH OST-type domain-containing protein n=1 Tax=Sinanodonta woodiana TaxID=1069815 RepID=A0ABD3XXT2_SINWO